MPETETTTTTTEEKKVTPPPAAAAPVFPPEMLEEMTRKAVETASKEAEKLSNKKDAERNKRLAIALGLDSPDDREARLAEKLLTNPSDVLTKVAQTAAQEGARLVREDIKAKEDADAEDNKFRNELSKAVKEALKDRPDVANDESAKELLDAYYLQQPMELSEKEKVGAALKKYDLLMEKNGQGSAEDRVKKASSPNASGNGSSSPAQKSRNEIWAESQKKRVADYKAKHGGRIAR